MNLYIWKEVSSANNPGHSNIMVVANDENEARDMICAMFDDDIVIRYCTEGAPDAIYNGYVVISDWGVEVFE